MKNIDSKDIFIIFNMCLNLPKNWQLCSDFYVIGIEVGGGKLSKITCFHRALASLHTGDFFSKCKIQ